MASNEAHFAGNACICFAFVPKESSNPKKVQTVVDHIFEEVAVDAVKSSLSGMFLFGNLENDIILVWRKGSLSHELGHECSELCAVLV